MKLQVGYETRRGSRHSKNQDALTTAQNVAPDLVAQTGRVLAVADGFGPDDPGAASSLAVVTALARSYYGSKEPERAAALRRAVIDADAELTRHAGADVQPGAVGCTVTAAVVFGTTVHVAQLGDSRAYLLHKGKLEQLTEDELWGSAQIKAGGMTAEEVAKDTRRNNLSRALGAAAGLTCDTVACASATLGPGDRLLLCSDGLTDVVPDSEIAKTLASRAARKAAAELVALAGRHGAGDDVSVVVAVPGPDRRPAIGVPLGIAAFVIVLVSALVLSTPRQQSPAAGPVETPSAVSTSDAGPTVAAQGAAITETATVPAGSPTSIIAAMQSSVVTRQPITPRPPTVTAEPAVPAKAVSAAPTLLAPENDAQYNGSDAEIRLRWEPVSGLAQGDLYVVISDFPAPDAVWRDWQVTDTTEFVVPRYLYDELRGTRRVEWRVAVWRNAAQDASGRWRGDAVSPESAARAYYWLPMPAAVSTGVTPATDTGQPPTGTPEPPPTDVPATPPP